MGAPHALFDLPRIGLVGHDAFGPGLDVLDAQDVGDFGHAVDAGKLGGGSLDVLLERAVRQEDDRAGIADARLAVLDLVDERDRDVVLGEDIDRLGQGAHAVGDFQAHIVLGLERPWA